jgi:hypothetical protein
MSSYRRKQSAVSGLMGSRPRTVGSRQQGMSTRSTLSGQNINESIPGDVSRNAPEPTAQAERNPLELVSGLVSTRDLLRAHYRGTNSLRSPNDLLGSG